MNDLAQNVVAGGVTEQIVNWTEAVQIDQPDGKRRWIPSALVNKFGNLAAQPGSVAEAS